jgi:translocator protein
VKRTTSGLIGLAIFVVLVVGPGFTIGYLNVPGGWYAGLNKPWFNPSNWIFAPVWAVIYVLIAIAGWRTWDLDRHGLAMRLWFVQMALNFLWPPTFFRCIGPRAR